MLRGKFRLEGLKTTNPLAVGDVVSLTLTEGQAPVITHIHPRKNCILRRSTRSHSQQQMLCANIDQAVFVFTLKEPFTPLSYADSFLVMCEAYHIPAVVVFNKMDLLMAEEQAHLADYAAQYEQAGYGVLSLSALAATAAPAVQHLLQGRVSFLGGASGAGKSTLVNLASPALDLRTGTISTHTSKGRHTTTYAELYALEYPDAHGAAVIDAPGFREFEVTGLAKTELSHYYPEMRALLQECRFNNCTHTDEPGCAIKAAYEAGTLAPARYHTYLNLLASVLTEGAATR